MSLVLLSSSAVTCSGLVIATQWLQVRRASGLREINRDMVFWWLRSVVVADAT